eukprot:CAMPEP_0184018366 /NCGR_PEP_ID=MMETSP0954-20121128/8107_1 /TAXON_ID=627963 /ORGANISM="Aplanochytrium sp, Strain PBS07" /LENGTH=141 /DNA_ID=CAMNT_0026299815 /DNA_START=869 /DNA_END=1294 /DNA_ORIENTATION=+
MGELPAVPKTEIACENYEKNGRKRSLGQVVKPMNAAPGNGCLKRNRVHPVNQSSFEDIYSVDCKVNQEYIAGVNEPAGLLKHCFASHIEKEHRLGADANAYIDQLNNEDFFLDYVLAKYDGPNSIPEYENQSIPFQVGIAL